MQTKVILMFLLILENVYSFVKPPIYQSKLRQVYMSNDYLQHISKHKEETKTKISKLKVDDKKLEKGLVSTYHPISKATFDTIFLNIYQINKIYISACMDRMIFEISSHRRYVFYINDYDEYSKMMQFIDLIPNKIKIIIINDVYKCMDDPFGFLYCEPRS